MFASNRSVKLLGPKYYKEFRCIADKCRHSCCIGWEIDVDGETIEKYKSLCGGYSEKIRNTIDIDGVPHFRLAENEKCPHLDERGLCRIISEYGEGFLCDICREHPRFYNDTPHTKEVGIGMSCEEAARIILSSDEYREMLVIGEIEGEVIDTEFDATAYREKLYEILSSSEITYTEKLANLYDIFGFSLASIPDEEYAELLDALEYLDESHRTMFGVYSSALKTPKECEKALERALAYFIYRHCTSAENELEFLATFGFSLFCERLLASLFNANKARNIDEMADLARILSEEIEYSEENTEAIKAFFTDKSSE